jgi:hypothetical protein
LMNVIPLLNTRVKPGKKTKEKKKNRPNNNKSSPKR